MSATRKNTCLPRKSNKLSRPERRASRRLASKERAYQGMVAISAIGGIEFTKPGRGNHW